MFQMEKSLVYLLITLSFETQGLRPELPKNIHPSISHITQRCWDSEPNKRPDFSTITVELEHLLEKIQVDNDFNISVR